MPGNAQKTATNWGLRTSIHISHANLNNPLDCSKNGMDLGSAVQ